PAGIDRPRRRRPEHDTGAQALATAGDGHVGAARDVVGDDPDHRASSSCVRRCRSAAAELAGPENTGSPRVSESSGAAGASEYWARKIASTSDARGRQASTSACTSPARSPAFVAAMAAGALRPETTVGE